MAAKPGKKSPSRERYEKSHPTVSARMPMDKRDKLFSVLARISLTLAQLLIRFADEHEIMTRPLEEARKEGFQEAKNLYAVNYPCNVCGKTMVITNPKTKEAVSRYMTDHGWGHEECHKRKQQL